MFPTTLSKSKFLLGRFCYPWVFGINGDRFETLFAVVRSGDDYLVHLCISFLKWMAQKITNKYICYESKGGKDVVFSVYLIYSIQYTVYPLNEGNSSIDNRYTSEPIQRAPHITIFLIKQTLQSGDRCDRASKNVTLYTSLTVT